MTEEYTLTKRISTIGLDIDITTPDKELLLKLDDTIRDLIIKHYKLNGAQYK